MFKILEKIKKWLWKKEGRFLVNRITKELLFPSIYNQNKYISSDEHLGELNGKKMEKHLKLVASLNKTADEVEKRNKIQENLILRHLRKRSQNIDTISIIRFIQNQINIQKQENLKKENKIQL